MSEGNGQSLLHLEGVTKVFVTDEVETHALSGIQMDIKKGEYVSISGPSGCGKSTLLAILGLLDTPTDGTYTLNGKPVSGLKLSERARIRNREIGFIFQAFNLIGDLTVYENVELPLTYRGMPSSERKKRVQEALDKVGMSHRMKHYPSQLSGGQQQRVAVARALCGDPLILLFIYNPASGWTRYPVWLVSDAVTRPILMIDQTNSILHVFATSSESGGKILEKTSPIGSPQFATGSGTTFMRDAATSSLNNATSTKQSVTRTTGLVVLASNDSTGYYWHGYETVP